MGYTVGRWEGDALVLDSISFVDTTWLGRGGFFHSDQMRVVEHPESQFQVARRDHGHDTQLRPYADLVHRTNELTIDEGRLTNWIDELD